jgi:hypothetical protein
VWSKLERILGEKSYGLAAERANAYLMRRHDITNTDRTIRGGVAGSWPVWGAYGRFKVLNWATKFFVDALLERVLQTSPDLTFNHLFSHRCFQQSSASPDSGQPAPAPRSRL